jgi:hypothetical protein
MKFANATNFNRKSGEAEGSAVSLNEHQMQMKAPVPPFVIPTGAQRSGGTYGCTQAEVSDHPIIRPAM